MKINYGKIETVPISHLRFDPQNPRLVASSVNGNDEQEVLKWMLNDATIIELMTSIGEQGYFPGEPLLVVPVNGDKGVYEVVEGNRRLSAVKLLLSPQLAPVRKKAVELASQQASNKPDQLPVIVYPKREEVLDYLGYRHITGVKPWGPLAKAKYLDQLRLSLKEQQPEAQFRVLAKLIGSRADSVARQLTGLRVYEEIENSSFFKIRGLDSESLEFGVLTTALGYSNISEYLGLASNIDTSLKGLRKDSLKKLTSWLFEKSPEGKTRVGESRKLKDLNKVVGNEVALREFEKGLPLDDAVLLTDAPIESFRTAVEKAKLQLQNAQNIHHLVSHWAQSDVSNITEIERMSRFLRGGIQEALLEKEQL